MQLERFLVELWWVNTAILCKKTLVSGREEEKNRRPLMKNRWDRDAIVRTSVQTSWYGKSSVTCRRGWGVRTAGFSLTCNMAESREYHRNDSLGMVFNSIVRIAYPSTLLCLCLPGCTLLCLESRESWCWVRRIKIKWLLECLLACLGSVMVKVVKDSVRAMGCSKEN